MRSLVVRLEEKDRRTLRSAFERVPARGGPVRVEVAKGAAPVEGEDEILVVVLGPRGGLATRRMVPSRDLDLNELRLMLLGAEAAVDEVANAQAAPNPSLTTAEAQHLDAVGLGEEGEGPGAFEKSLIEFELLVRQSLTLENAAKRLGVNASRLRQRLAERTLYGIKENRSWRLPKFQFDTKGKKLVRGLEAVLPHVRVDAHPLAVAKWFAAPHQDLVVGAGGDEEETAVSPLEWLRAGGKPGPVAELAEEI